ncbi:MAG: hypothetical protein A4E74_02224 [Syntrophus sp. PtaB.Bin075]|nr:MAG: hypothetical protein A4E74_02224 [Syntrophus sp. PtaB.Bin075]
MGQESIPILELGVLGNHKAHAFRLEGRENLHRRTLIDPGHDGGHRGHGEIELIPCEERRCFRTAFCHDQLERGDRLSVAYQFILVLGNNRSQVNAHGFEGLSLLQCDHKGGMMGREDIAHFQIGNLRRPSGVNQEQGCKE